MPTTRQRNRVKKWVTALRSGEYKQGKFVLQTTSNTFCCLGVLCDINAPKGWTKNLRHRFDNGTEGMMDINKFSQLTGLYPVTANKLATMNDDGLSFEHIANKIEQFMNQRIQDEADA